MRYREFQFSGGYLRCVARRSPIVGDRLTQSNSCFRLKVISFFGTASFLGFRRGIEDVRIDGDKISFSVRFQAASEA